jgi:glycosyltransferase involved in cell wall biosynthesis
VRILQLHTEYRVPGGEDTVVRAEKKVLEESGHDVLQHLEHNPENVVGSAAALAGSVWNIRAARRVAEVAEQFRPDIAHVHNTWFASSPSVLAPLKARRIPIVMTVHNYRLACANSLFLRAGTPCEKCVDHGAWQAVRHRCYRGSRAMSAVAAGGIAVHRRLQTWSRLVDRFLVLSEFARDRLVRAGLPANRITIGSNFVPDPGVRAERPSVGRTVLFVGRISPEKGLSVLLDAWRRVSVPGLELDIVGDGPERARLQAGAPSGTTFLGALPASAVMDRLQRARALIIPSVWYEGQPMTALEGLAAGTPLVLSDIGGLPEVLGGSAAGWLVQPARADALANALEQLGNDVSVDVRGQAARECWTARFTSAAAVARLERTYAAAREACSA